MSIILDIILVAILAASIYRGYKTGIINVGYKIVATIASILLAIILCSAITHLVIAHTDIDEKIEETIIANNTMAEIVAKPISEKIVGIAVIILLYLIARIIFTIIKTFTNIIAKIPIIKQCNEIAGLIYGLLIGLLIIYGILAITFFIISMSGNTSIKTIIENTFITKLFYDNNMILNLL